jgi:hypothetical protein
MGGINIIEGIISQEITLFRPPFGVSNPVIAAIIKKKQTVLKKVQEIMHLNHEGENISLLQLKRIKHKPA